jgi:hypothetical protein
MKTVYLLYISAGVALATIFYLYKSHKETMKKIETIQNLVSSIQQVPVMKYNDTEIQNSIKTRCDELEELIHFVNDEINTKLDITINRMNENATPVVNKLNNNKTNIPKTFFSEFMENQEFSNTHLNKNNQQDVKSNNNETIENNIHNIGDAINQEDDENVFKEYQNEPILDVENYKNNEFSGISLSSLDKDTLDPDSVHNSSAKIDKNILGEVNLDNNEDLIDTYSLNNNINMDFDINLSKNSRNGSVKSVSNNNKQKEFSTNNNTSNNHSVSDNSKIPKLNELKQIAKSMDLSINGNKKEIIQRLLDNGYIF